ncbi:alpha-hydroxy acid oxidase [Aquabacterium sp. G14]|uniref:alpha-hydroxy acid oxidase n=1 Tax=Aquabacterium sp. G14 TaxID=3130164 RepID=UPI0030DA5005
MPNALNQIPDGLHAAQDYERLAPEFIEPSTWHYIQGGSGQELTLQANQGALARLRLQPRLLRPLAHGHTRLTLLGQPRLHPILLAPVAYQRLVHPLGELATAQGAHAMDAGMIVSTLSSTLLEDIAPLTHDKWFQLYFQPNRQVTLDLIRRAEHAQYQALVVTLDATIKSPSGRALRSGFVMPDAVRHVNLDRYPTPTSRPLRHGDSMVFQGIMADAPTWDDLRWLQTQTQLPIVVKGVQHPADARVLQEMGIAAQVVSNHGGRALDGAPASITVLPSIRAAVGPGYPLLLDSGIRSGQDIFKALALGANAVLIGRLQVYALAVAGALGVAHMLRTLHEELELCMAQAGCATLADITPDILFDSASKASPC